MNPSLRQLRLASVLRRLREQQGLQAQDVARDAGIAKSSVTRIEACQVKPRPQHVVAMARAMGADDRMVNALERLAKQVQKNERGVLQVAGAALPERLVELLAAEADATLSRYYSADLIPSLLQTEDYARAIITAGSPASSSVERDRRIGVRLERQKRLHNREITQHVVVGEVALRRPVGGHSVMAGQLEKLAELVNTVTLTAPVTFQVVPDSLPNHPALGTNFELLTLDAWEYAYVESAHGGNMIEDSNEVAAFRAAWEGVLGAALDTESSLHLVGKYTEEHKRNA